MAVGRFDLKVRIRQDLADDVSRFLKSGGSITPLPYGPDVAQSRIDAAAVANK
jgi:hypothetical protein